MLNKVNMKFKCFINYTVFNVFSVHFHLLNKQHLFVQPIGKIYLKSYFYSEKFFHLFNAYSKEHSNLSQKKDTVIYNNIYFSKLNMLLNYEITC